MMVGMWALYAREVKRFQKIILDTVFSPLVNIVLYLAIFGFILGDRVIGGVPYTTFVYLGLLTMMLINSSFSNPSFALIIAKNVGSIIDLLLVPIKNWQIGVAYALAALTRGLITLAITIGLTVWFIDVGSIAHPILLIAGVVLTGVTFGMLGVIFGFLAKNFESLQFITTFVMQPMIMLAGTFYSIASLPYPWNVVSAFNPIHHNINVIRFAVTGYGDGNATVSLGVVIIVTILMFVLMGVVTRKNLRLN